MAAETGVPKFEKAKLFPLQDNDQADTANGIDVVFNPASLKITITNQMKADGGAGASRDRPAQFVEKSSTSLAVELVLDTTLPFKGGTDLDLAANADVRRITQKIATLFVQPENRSDGKLGAPKRVQFSWGSFVFNGMITSYSETIDFFAPEGIPLRATLALTISEDKFQFLRNNEPEVARDSPAFSPAPPAQSLPSALQNSGQDPRNWRGAALFNGLETPRFSANISAGLASSSGIAGVGAVANANFASAGGALGVSAGFSMPTASASLSVSGAGFSFGASSNLGTNIAGAFKVSS